MVTDPHLLPEITCVVCRLLNIKLTVFPLAVYATMRNTAKAEALVEAAGQTLGRTLEIKQLDVCDENSIRACVDSLPMRKIDILSKGFL